MTTKKNSLQPTAEECVAFEKWHARQPEKIRCGVDTVVAMYIFIAGMRAEKQARCDMCGGKGVIIMGVHYEVCLACNGTQRK